MIKVTTEVGQLHEATRMEPDANPVLIVVLVDLTLIETPIDADFCPRDEQFTAH